ncbi:MAG TPA: hypothetical protein VNZ86_08805 [Bacteroidia bacterium]|nr:hypothetical protein [Bacteroidia bacterium]
MCRNAYHNRNNSNETNYVRNINNILRKNRRVLQELLAEEETLRCPFRKLNEMGFDFNYFTGIYRNRKGDTYYFCYEFGYLPLEKDSYCLVRKRIFTP